MKEMIVARDLNNGIGFQGKKPWHIPDDLKWFKRHTLGKNCIVGRKTFANLPPLPNRKLYVMSKSINLPSRYIVIGGGEIYRMFINDVDKIYETEILETYTVDTYFCGIPDGFYLNYHEECDGYNFKIWLK